MRPVESFAQLWPRVTGKAKRQKIHFAVVGAGAAGLELAMAAAQALDGPFYATGGQVPGAGYSPATQRRIASALERLRVEVLLDACVGMGSGEIRLAGVAHLACDMPLPAVEARAPAWFASSGQPLAPYQPQKRTLCLLSCGGRGAIAVRGGFSTEGAWVWRWENRIDHRLWRRMPPELQLHPHHRKPPKIYYAPE